MRCGECGGPFRLVKTGRKYEYSRCPCGIERRVEKEIPIGKVLAPYLREMERLEQAYQKMGLYD